MTKKTHKNSRGETQPHLSTKREISVNKIMYKGYEIEAIPYKSAESGEWSVNIHISHNRKNEIRIKPFAARNRFDTENEAIQHCFNFGRQIIDVQIENCSVDDL